MWSSSDATVSRRRAGLGAASLAAALLLTGWDLLRICTTAPSFALGLQGGLAFLLVGTAATACCLTIPLSVRQLLIAGSARWGAPGAALVGAVEAAALIYAALLLQNPRSISGDLRVAIAIAAVVLLAAIRWALHVHDGRLHGWAKRAPGAIVLAGSLAALLALRWNGSTALRFALQVAFAVGLSSVVLLPRSRTRLLGALPLATAALIVCSASVLLSPSPGARFALHHRGSHVRPAIAFLGGLFDRDGDAATNWFGGRDCDERRADVFPGAAELAGDDVDNNCSGRDRYAEPPRSTASARAGETKRGDVLLLSIDSLRWDALSELASLREELGPHVVFERAVSGAPATRESLATAMRGRPLRRLHFEKAANAHGPVLWREPAPTLGHVLARAGYRVVTVPTSHVADPRNGVQSGFDSIWAANYDARVRPPTRSPFDWRYTAADDVLAVLGATAAETPGPLCVWAHLMEPHAPYPVRDPSSCDRDHASSCYRAALRDTSDRLAAFLREFTRKRGKPAVVAVFGDHGEEFGEHGGDFHGSTVHAEQVRVSFLLSAPELLDDAHVRAPVSLASLPATVLDLLSLPVPSTMLEPSLVPALRGERPWQQLATSEHAGGGSRMVGYTGNKYRYLHDPVHDVELLFDMDSDPYEKRDLSQVDRAGLAAMRALARAWDETEHVDDLSDVELSAEAKRVGARE